jgi:transcription initiation factor IIE alpha subunit
MCNELYNNDREYRPVILSRIDLSREELDRIIKLYNHRLKSYLAQVRERMKEIDTLYQPKLKKLKQQIKSEKREVLRRKPAGLDLGKIVLSNIGNFPNF